MATASSLNQQPLSQWSSVCSARSKPRRRKDCTKFKLLGECEDEARCKFAHVVKLEPDRICTTYVELPDGLPMGLAVGRKASNLRRIMNAVGCLLTQSERSEREVKVITANKGQLSIAEEKLRVLFAQLYPISPSCCYLHTDGISEIITGKLLLEFKKYEGRTPFGKQVLGEPQLPMYEVSCCETVKAKAVHDTSIEELEKLNPITLISPLDSKHNLHSELDRIMQGPSASKLTPKPAPAPHTADKPTKTMGPTVRIMTEYKKDIRQHLQNALEWILKNRAHDSIPEDKCIKLEARFGKVLCFHLAEDVLTTQPWGVDKFAKFIFTDTNYTQLFNTDVKKKNVEQLCAEIKDISDAKPALKTFDIKFTTGQDQYRQKLDLRLTIEGGQKPKAILVKQNETKVIVLDLFCLHRQHDIRICLSRLQIMPPTDKIISELLKTLTFLEPGTLTLIPCTDDWTVEFIRYKKRTAYIIDDKYMVTVTAVQEYRTAWEKLPNLESVTVKFEDNPELTEHFEVEFQNILWECTFGKDVGFPPEKALALHTEHPAITPQLAASIPHPWGVQDILQDYDEFLDYLDQLNESLGMVVA